MREIKFRAWDLINNKWLNLWTIKIAITGDVMAVSDLAGELYGTHQVELMQYTGLKDKNGKEIYEGDILAIQYAWGLEKMEVKWAHHGFAVQDGWGDWFPGQEQSEVIGNIYENPELLKP